MRRRSRAFVASSLMAAALAGCSAPRHGTERAPEPVRQMTLLVDASPGEVITRLKYEARAQGGAVVAETADCFTVDFGVQTRRIAVPSAADAGGAPDVLRETEVHESATYGVRSAQGGGTLVSISHTPTWWNPVLRCWLPGPRDAAPRTGRRDVVGGPR